MLSTSGSYSNSSISWLPSQPTIDPDYPNITISSEVTVAAL